MGRGVEPEGKGWGKCRKVPSCTFFKEERTFVSLGHHGGTSLTGKQDDKLLINTTILSVCVETVSVREDEVVPTRRPSHIRSLSTLTLDLNAFFINVLGRSRTKNGVRGPKMGAIEMYEQLKI